MRVRDCLLLPVIALTLVGCTALPMAEPAVNDAGKEVGRDIREPSAPLPDTPLPDTQRQQRSPAVTALLAKARSERADGRYEHSTVSLERALRIEARDAELWLELAVVRFEAEDFDAALQFADKARLLAAGDDRLRREAERLGQAARLRIR